MMNRSERFKVTLEVSRLETFEITNAELACILEQRAFQLANIDDDAGCDWATDEQGNTYVGGDWRVSSNPAVALMIDLAWRLKGYEPEKIQPEPEDPAPTLTLED